MSNFTADGLSITTVEHEDDDKNKYTTGGEVDETSWILGGT